MQQRTCPCGTPFEITKKQGPPQRYCSIQCRSRANRDTARERDRAAAIARGSLIGYSDCTECGRLFVFRRNQGNPRSVCSTACRNRRNKRQRSAEALAKRAAYKRANKTKHAEYQRRYRQARPEEERQREAERRKRRWRYRPRVVEARQKIRRAGRGTSGKRWRWAQGWCLECGEQFLASANGHLPCYCSDKCSKSAHSARRRAVEVGAFVAAVSRQAIYERDDWRCQLCRKKVRRAAVVPHPLAAVLDHIIPLAVGGAHEPSNVQCAHFLCNSIKSHGIGGNGDQLRLIG